MSLCTRCGKSRVVVKTYTEKLGNSIVTYTINECPDPECQKIVDREIRADERKRVDLKKDQLKRELLRNQDKENKKHGLVL